jgi:hypothetical protein
MVLSYVEVEYMAACEALWLRKLFFVLFGVELEATVIHCDNHSGIKISENHVFHDRIRKHIDICYHFLRDCVQKGVMRLQYVETDDHMADIFTKALSKTKV